MGAKIPPTSALPEESGYKHLISLVETEGPELSTPAL